MATKANYDEMYKKYIRLSQGKAPFQIDKGFLTPTMGEMMEEDLAYEAFKASTDLIGSETNPTKVAFYTHPPFRDTLGYDEDLDAMLVEAPIKKNLWNGIDVQWLWNDSDGDTLSFAVKDVNAGKGPLIIKGQKYKDFEEYIGTKPSDKESASFSVRFVGINCAELPHYITKTARKEQTKDKIVKRTYGQIKNNPKYKYVKFPISNGKIHERKDSDEMLFYIIEDGTFHEVMTNVNEKLEVGVPLKSVNNKYSQYKIPNNKESVGSKDKDYETFLVVGKDDSEKDRVLDGYKAQKANKKLLGKSNKIRLVLDCGTFTVANKINNGSTAISSPFYSDEFLQLLRDELIRDTTDLRISGLSYNLYGTDVYGRFLTEVYMQDSGSGKWINANKYVLANTNYTEAIPDYTGKPELNGKKLTDAFQIWTYDYENIKWLDAFEELGEKSYERRMALHENLSGLKLCEMRDHTVLIGDTLLMIPPTNIRAVSQTTYERVPLLRSKGTLVKGGNHNESLIEMTLYFAKDHGVNGIPYEHEFPNGEKCTYYMNGLRSLIAQFKLTPFLPIENEYINDVLGVEAVSLLALDTETVPEFPQLLKVTLTVREFNYRLFMPDLPLGIEQDITKPSLAELNPIFAKSFQWEVFRYYYQRLMLAGETLHKLEYNSPDYNEYMYRMCTALQPVTFCSSDISIYIPDIDWLDSALQLKKEQDDEGVLLSPPELSDNARDIAKAVAGIKNTVMDARKDAEEVINKKIMPTMNRLSFYGYKKQYGTHVLNGKSYIYFQTYSQNEYEGMKDENDEIKFPEGITSNVLLDYHVPIYKALEDRLFNTGIVSEVTSEEIKKENENGTTTIIWNFKFKTPLFEKNMNQSDFSAIKEFLANQLEIKDKMDILKDGYFRLAVSFEFDKDKKCTDVTLSDDHFDRIFDVLKMLGDGKITTTDQDAISKEEFDWKDPSKMKFVPYVENVKVTNISISMANSFTETKLKSVDGVSAQYVGGQDLKIDMKLLTCDKLVVSALNTLPSVAFEYVNKYRRIITCSPIRIKNELTQMMGLNEVLLDMIDINTVEGFPGAYEITLRMSSVDRTIRQRENLRKMDFTSNGGFIGRSTGGYVGKRSYFEIDKVLSGVEIYPDLELPSLADLKARGYCYIKYTLSNEQRVYPDPDFYMVYTYSYTAAKLKVLIDKFFKDMKDNKAEINSIEITDTDLNAKLMTKLDDAVGLTLVGQCQTADKIDAEVQKLALQLSAQEERANIKKEKSNTKKDTEKALKYLLLCDTTDGWKIKPTWSAPLCDSNTNDLIRDMPRAGTESHIPNNPVASDLKILRRDAIRIIDSILSKPIDIKPNESLTVGKKKSAQEDAIWEGITKAIRNVFGYKGGDKLLNMLNPMGNTASNSFMNNKYKDANILSYLRGFMYSAACIASAEKDYQNNLGPDVIVSTGWGPRLYYNVCEPGMWHSSYGARIVMCRTEAGTNAVPRRPKDVSSSDSKSDSDLEKWALDDALEQGTVFGPFGITKYSEDEIISMTTPELNIKYVEDNEYPLYKTKPKAGFLDPYYNKAEGEELRKYKLGILTTPEYAAVAYLRNVLVWIRKLILDGLFFSDLDSIAKDVKEAFGGKMPDKEEVEKKLKEAGKEDTLGSTAVSMVKDMFAPIQNIFSKKNHVLDKDDLYGDYSDLYLMMVSLSDTLPKSFCMRLIYPILMASTDSSPILFNAMLNRDYTGLESMANASTSSGKGDKFTADIRTFFSAMYGLRMIDINDPKTAWADESQKMVNAMMEEAYITASKDPRAYVMHSYYDMLMNDKRGRLVRAFPTYYMILIDEGRKIGNWKLHDNFYNMSSIAEIQIVKSRKNPADTCSVIMTNMYRSYSDEYDNATKYQYADLYGIKDVFYNIFSPGTYYQKVDDIRTRTEIKDTVVLKAGTRMHIKMGYGADASRLPAAFNGRIAELNVGETVEIIGQGDGVELVNPLNALGNIEADQIETAQSWFFPKVLTKLRGSLFEGGGYSPKNLLASILTAEHGDKEKVFNYLSNDRFFNTNPFGILHFGNQKYTEIFNQGEVVQNLYEVTDDNILPNMNVLKQKSVPDRSTPIINVSLFDKTFWDLMHIAAKSGDDYICGVRDFGFRSTIFLGRPNYYYAYAYKEQNGNIYEKRKPFQQYHFIDSYGDIVYNAIKASERDIKTNATGLWQGTSKIHGRKSKTVGPVYLDANIYPEYQKSMTYDTGLLANGNGGIDIPLFRSIGEGRLMSGKAGQENKTYDDKVNVRLAEVMTINALKDSVKDMYQGDVCILGNPAIKPFDRITINDIYEDMVGDFEVESVVHTLNAQTGFTTSIHPDLIVRQKQNQQEIAARYLNGACCASTYAVLSIGYAGVLMLSRIDSKLLRAVLKSSPTLAITSTTSTIASKLLTSTKVVDHLAKVNPKIAQDLNKFGIQTAGSAIGKYSKSLSLLMDELGGVFKTQPPTNKEILEFMDRFSKLNPKELDNHIENVIRYAEAEKESFGDIDLAKMREEFSQFKNNYKSLFGAGEDAINFNNLFETIESLDPKVYKKMDKKLIDVIKNNGGYIKDRKQLKKVFDMLNKEEILEVLAKDEAKDAFHAGTKSLIKFGMHEGAEEGAEFIGLQFLKKGILKNVDSVIGKLVAKGGLGSIGGLPGLMASLAIQFTISTIFGITCKAIFAAWFDNLQTLTIFPLKQYGKNYTAGVSGAKCCVHGAPPSDGYNSIQGMIIQAAEITAGWGGILGFTLGDLAQSLLFDSNQFDKAANQYKVALGITEDNRKTDDQIVEDVHNMVSKQFINHADSVYAVKARARIQSFDTTNKDGTGMAAYNKYAIRNINPSQIPTNKKVSELIAIKAYPDLQSYIQDGRLVLAHDYQSKEAVNQIRSVTVNQNNKQMQINMLPRESKDIQGWDLPMLRRDANFVLKTILDENYKLPDKEAQHNKFELHSGTVVNQKSWNSTGYRFVIKAKNQDALKKTLSKVDKKLNNGTFKVFTYSPTTKYPGYYRVTVYPEKD